MRTKRYALTFVLTAFLLPGLGGCVSLPKQTVELAEITETRTAELQKSHIRFVQLYFGKIRAEIDEFIEKRWMPLFLSKAVCNRQFRKDLDQAYLTSTVRPSDVQVSMKGKKLKEPQRSAVLYGIERAVCDERARLGGVLFDFSEEAQRQIIRKRQELVDPINEQERMVINEINSAYADLRNSQASLKAFLASAADVKEKQDIVMHKLGLLEQSRKILNGVLDANEEISAILKEREDVEECLNQVLEMVRQVKKHQAD